MNTENNIIIQSMFNIDDEELTLTTLETDPEGITIVTFPEGTEKVFDTLEKAWKFSRKYGFID